MPNGPLKTVGEHPVTVAPHTDVVVDVEGAWCSAKATTERSRTLANRRAALSPALFRLARRLLRLVLRYALSSCRLSTGLSTGAVRAAPVIDFADVRRLSSADAIRDADPRRRVARLRVPPHSVEAEQSVLGGLLLDNGAWDRAGDLLTESDFYRYEHRLIYARDRRRWSTRPSRPTSSPSSSSCRASARPTTCGGLAYLNALAQSVPSAANIRRYAEIVRERAVLRKLVAASDEIADQRVQPAGPRGRARSSTTPRPRSSHRRGGLALAPGLPEHGRSCVVQLIDRVNELHENGAEEVTGVRTGFYDLDRMTAGPAAGRPDRRWRRGRRWARPRSR